MYSRTVTLAHVALLLHITVLVGGKSTQRFGYLNENLWNKYVISVFVSFSEATSGGVWSLFRCICPPK